MRKFEINENLAAAIQQYLAARPLKETYDMFNALANLKEIPQPQGENLDEKKPDAAPAENASK